MNIHIDKDSAIPYYFQIKEAIQGLIDHGALKPGDMLPSEVSLCEQLDVSRLTIHRAYRELGMQGAVVRKRAIGTFIALPPEQAYLAEGPLFGVTESMAKSGMVVSSRILVQEIINASEVQRRALRLLPGGRVVHLRTLRILDQLPFSLEDIFLPYERFPELATIDLNDQSLYALLDQRYDALPQEAEDRISAGAATASEAALLDIRESRPVMRVQRASCDRQGYPVEFTLAVYRAEHFQFVAHVRRK